MNSNPFYKLKKWEKKRANVLKRDKYLCRECQRYGKSTPATTVHHIFPLEFYPEYSLTNENLYSCCNACHNSFHDRDSHELTIKGIQLKERFKDAITKT